MRHPTILALLLVAALHATADDPVAVSRWDAETSRSVPFAIRTLRGESRLLEAKLLSYRKPVELPVAATAVFCYQTNGMGEAWWTVPAETRTNGLVRVVWTPAMDAGASEYSFFFRVEAPGGIDYSAYGGLRVLGSPGTLVNEIPFPVRMIDFSSVAVTNAPWLLAESDPAFAEWARTNTVYTAAQVDAAIAASSPADYATVSNRAMTALQVEEEFRDWAETNTFATELSQRPILTDSWFLINPYDGEDLNLLSLASKEYTDAAAAAATNYTDEAIEAIQFPDTSLQPATNYTDSVAAELRAAIAAAEPGDYVTVSNRAMSAVQTERDPLFAEWAHTNQIAASLAGKQATIGDLATIRAGAAAGATAVQDVLAEPLPSGVPSGSNIGGWISMADMFLGSLPSGNDILTATADGGNITRGYNGQNFTSLSINGSLIVTSDDSRLSDARPPTAHTHTAAQVTGLAAVATSGSYNDLTDKPAAPVETDPVALPLIAAAARAATNYTDAAIAAMPPPSGGADLTEVSNIVNQANTQLLAEAPDSVALASQKAIIADLWQRVDAIEHTDGSDVLTAAEAEAIVNDRVAPLEAMVAQWSVTSGMMPVQTTNRVQIALGTSDRNIAPELSPLVSTEYSATGGSSGLTISAVSGVGNNPCWLIIKSGFSSASFPSGSKVSGGSYQAGSDNYFRVSRVSDALLFERISP